MKIDLMKFGRNIRLKMVLFFVDLKSNSALLYCTLIGLNALSLPPSFAGSANLAFLPIRAQYRSVQK